MIDQGSDAPDAVRDADTMVSGLLETLVADYGPKVDLVPAALAGARRAKRRVRVAWTAGGALVTATAVAAVLAAGATVTRSVPTAIGTEGSAPATQGAVARGSTAHAHGALDAACVGKWLPWTDQSDAVLFGKGTDAQRAVVCTEDIDTVKTVMPGFKVTPMFEPYSDGKNTDFTSDQIAQLGPGLSPNTPILKPWQYAVIQHGKPTYFYVTYSGNRADVCTGCTTSLSQPLPGPRPGYRLIAETPKTGSPVDTVEVLVETPEHTYLGIGLSPMSNGVFTPPFDVSKLVKDSRFLAALDADLGTLYGS